jgi:hypothetical protein
MMEEQRTILLNERQEALARALRSFPQKPDGELEVAWPEGHELYRALQGLHKNILNVPGRFLYSDISTLGPGDYYFLGTNPYIGPPLRADIQGLGGNRTNNAYLDEAWDARDGSTLHVGEHPIQERVQELFKAIIGNGPDASVRQVCSSHLVFSQSESENTQVADAEDFWQVHEAVMRIVNPVCVLVMGSGRAYKKTKKLLKKLLGGFSEQEGIGSGNPTWPCKVAQGNTNDRPKLLIGMPHFGCWGLDGQALKQIAEKCRAAAGR